MRHQNLWMPKSLPLPRQPHRCSPPCPALPHAAAQSTQMTRLRMASMRLWMQRVPPSRSRRPARSRASSPAPLARRRRRGADAGAALAGRRPGSPLRSAGRRAQRRPYAGTFRRPCRWKESPASLSGARATARRGGRRGGACLASRTCPRIACCRGTRRTCRAEAARRDRGTAGPSAGGDSTRTARRHDYRRHWSTHVNPRVGTRGPTGRPRARRVVRCRSNGRFRQKPRPPAHRLKPPPACAEQPEGRLAYVRKT